MMSKEKAFLLAIEVARIWHETSGMEYEEAFAEVKKLYGVK